VRWVTFLVLCWVRSRLGLTQVRPASGTRRASYMATCTVPGPCCAWAVKAWG